MPSKNTMVECETCKKTLLFGSLRRHKTSVHKENVPAQVQIIKVEKPIFELLAPFTMVPEKDPTKILLKKIEGCKEDFNGTKSSMQLYFSYDEYNLLLECVKECLKKKEESVQIKSIDSCTAL